MVGYIQNPLTYEPVAQVEIDSYVLPIETKDGVTGKVDIIDLKGNYANYMLTFEDKSLGTYVIRDQSGQSGDVTTVNVENFIFALNYYRRCDIPTTETITPAGMIIRYDDIGSGERGIGGALTYKSYATETLADHGKYIPRFSECFCGNLTAAEFKATYLDTRLPLSEENCENIYVERLSKETKDGVTYNRFLTSSVRALAYLQNFGFSFKHSISKKWIAYQTYTTCAEIEIIPNDISTIAGIVFDDGHNELLSADFDDSVVSCVITVPKIIDDPEIYFRTTIAVYLNADMMATTRASDQISGEIAHTVCNRAYHDDIIAAAQEVFDKNTWTHKIEFASDREFHIGQPVRLALDRSVLDTTISQVVKKSTDKRFIYTCGELAATASDKITANDWHYGRRTPRAANVGSFYIT